MNFDEMEVRRRILRLASPGDSATVVGDFETIAASAVAFGKARGIPLTVAPVEGGALLTRVERSAIYGAGAFPEIASLEPGGSVLISVAPAAHQRVRLAASTIGRNAGRVFRCARTGDDITVIRIDGADPAAVAMPARATKYGLERLAFEPRMVLHVDARERRNLRVAASQKAASMGWCLRCRLQDDGTMLVYRTDAGAAQQAAE